MTEMNIDLLADIDFTAQERAALVTARLCTQQFIAMDDVRALTGLSASGAWYLMNKLSRVMTIWYDRPTQTWRLSV